MTNFDYRAAQADGKIIKASIVAADKKSAVLAIKRRGLSVLDIKSAGEAAGGVFGPSGDEVLKVGGGEKTALAFFKKIHQLCKSGTPAGDALRGLSQRSLNKDLCNLSKELYKGLSEGKSLSIAMEAYPKIFERSIIHLVEAGESTANLVPVFENIIDYLETRRMLRGKVIAALIYPAVLFVVAFAVVLLFLFVLLPQIEGMMKSLGGDMSLPVKILMSFGNFMLTGGPFLILGVIATIAVIYKMRQTLRGQLITDRALLRLPIFGKIALDSDICRFSNLISTLFESGVNTTETFRLAEKSVKNSDTRARFQLCRAAVNDGAPVAASFKKYGLLSDDDIDIIAVGDRTGNMIDGFAEIKNTHMEILGERVKYAIALLSALALMCAFALVFMVALGIVSAVLNLSQNLVK